MSAEIGQVEFRALDARDGQTIDDCHPEADKMAIAPIPKR